MLEVYKPHTNRFAVGVLLCSAAKRPSKRSALVSYYIMNKMHRVLHFYTRIMYLYNKNIIYRL